MVKAGKKAAHTRKTATYTFEEHANRLNKDLVDLHNEIREYIVNLDSSIEETPRQNYISYKTSQNFVCLESQKRKMMFFLSLEKL